MSSEVNVSVLKRKYMASGHPADIALELAKRELSDRLGKRVEELPKAKAKAVADHKYRLPLSPVAKALAHLAIETNYKGPRGLCAALGLKLSAGSLSSPTYLYPGLMTALRAEPEFAKHTEALDKLAQLLDEAKALRKTRGLSAEDRLLRQLDRMTDDELEALRARLNERLGRKE